MKTIESELQAYEKEKATLELLLRKRALEQPKMTSSMTLEQAGMMQSERNLRTKELIDRWCFLIEKIRTLQACLKTNKETGIGSPFLRFK